MSLSKNEQKIYELLKNRELYRNEKGIFTMCPQRLLVKLSGKNERTVQRALKGLEEQEYIRREWLAKEHLMLFYFLNEDFLERTIYDRYENCRHSDENCRHSDENCRHSDENCRHSDENCRHSGENCTHSGENCRHSDENVTPPDESCTYSTNCTEKMSVTAQSVTENEHNSTICSRKQHLLHKSCINYKISQKA